MSARGSSGSDWLSGDGRKRQIQTHSARQREGHTDRGRLTQVRYTQACREVSGEEIAMTDGAGNTTNAFWLMAGMGFLLPWIVIISCEIYFGRAAEIKHFPEQLFESG